MKRDPITRKQEIRAQIAKLEAVFDSLTWPRSLRKAVDKYGIERVARVLSSRIG